MIERLLENWLIRANERSFQIPFCHWLAFTGHTVVHLSRHCSTEFGKDILAIGPDGVPCAYQLKGVDGTGKMSLSKWNDDLGKQVSPLVNLSIDHPSVPPGRPHRAYIVINGELQEEVFLAIAAFNRNLVNEGRDRKVEVIVRGQLFQWFKELQSEFWATNLGDLKTYLELYQEDGRGQLPKRKLASLFESSLPFGSADEKVPSVAEATKSIAGCAIICASSISAFTNAKNHVAEFEAWTMYWGYVLGLVEKWSLPRKEVQFAIDVALEAMYSALGRLCDELMDRQKYSEGNILADRPMYEVRMTHLLGLMGIYGLWRDARIRSGVEEEDDDRRSFLRRFVEERSKHLALWGEYAIPQFLACNFYRRTFDATQNTDYLYAVLIEGIVKLNGEQNGLLPNPYYDAETYFPHHLGLEPDPLEDSFKGSSYYLEGLLHLLIKTNLKQRIRDIFPSVTRLSTRQYIPDEQWQYYFFRTHDVGRTAQRFMQPPHKWSVLREVAHECQGDDLPQLIKEFPLGYLCFLCVYPHRVNSSGLRWLDSKLEESRSSKRG